MTEQLRPHWKVNLPLCFWESRVSASREPSHQLGFLNLINTVSGNCLVSDLEQHVSLLPFYFWKHFCTDLDPQIHPQLGMIAWAGSFYEYPEGCSPSDLSSVPSLASMLIHWWAGIQAPPPSEWSVRLWSLQEGGCWAEPPWVPTSVKGSLSVPQKNLGTILRSSLFSPPRYSSVCLSFSSFLQEFPIEALTANSTGVGRQPVTQTETEVSPRRLSLFYWQRLLALLRGIPCCLRWVAVGNGVNVKYWNLPSTSSDY